MYISTAMRHVGMVFPIELYIKYEVSPDFVVREIDVFVQGD